MTSKKANSKNIGGVKNNTKKECNHPGTNIVEGTIKGLGGYRFHQGKNYKIGIDTSSVCQVNVIDKTARSAKAVANNQSAKGDWVFRLDKPHGKFNYNHVNINPTISGRPDPHVPISSNTLAVGKGVAKVCKVGNKVAVPIAIAVDTVSVGISVKDDIKNKTSRNTVETVAGVAGGWGGGYGGAAGGAAIGTAICPGIGTIIGGVAGGLAGGVTGSLGARKAASLIGDACNYDTDIIKCKKCGKTFKVRRYQGEKRRSYCDNC